MLSYFTPFVPRKLRLQYGPCLGSQTGKLQSLAWHPGLLTRFRACPGPPWPEGEIWEGRSSEKRRVRLEVGTGRASEHGWWGGPLNFLPCREIRTVLQGRRRSAEGQAEKQRLPWPVGLHHSFVMQPICSCGTRIPPTGKDLHAPWLRSRTIRCLTLSPHQQSPTVLPKPSQPCGLPRYSSSALHRAVMPVHSHWPL